MSAEVDVRIIEFNRKGRKKKKKKRAEKEIICLL